MLRKKIGLPSFICACIADPGVDGDVTDLTVKRNRAEFDRETA